MNAQPIHHRKPLVEAESVTLGKALFFLSEYNRILGTYRISYQNVSLSFIFPDIEMRGNGLCKL